MNTLPKGRLAIVIVTYNRLSLLKGCLASLQKQVFQIDKVFVIDNASNDGTEQFLKSYQGLPLETIRQEENTGGAGGFSKGVKLAYEKGFDWIFLMDDDVFPEPNCLSTLMKYKLPAMIAVREDINGQLVERSAIEYNLNNPFCLNPKRKSISEFYKNRKNMPEILNVHNIAFEGFMVHRDIVQQVGFPDPDYFIFYDDVDYALRIRGLGYTIIAVRDAVLVRQLDFDQKAALNSWKAYYMFRNLFHIHYRFGTNIWVKYKPYLLALGAFGIALLRGRMKQAKAIFYSIQDFKTLTNTNKQ